MTDVAAAIDYESINVLLTPKDAGSRVDGVWVPSPGAEITIVAAVQPTSGSSFSTFGSIRKDLPEGVMSEGKYALWSRYDIKKGDGVIIENDRHLIIHVMPRRQDGFVKAIAGEADGGN